MSIVELKTSRGIKMYTIIDKIAGVAGRVILITKRGNAIETNESNIKGEWEI